MADATPELQRPTTAASIDVTIVDDIPSLSASTNTLSHVSSIPTTEEIAKAEQEWAEVEKIQGELKSSGGLSTVSSRELVISYKDAESYFLNLDLTEEKKNIVSRETRKGLAALLHNLFGTHLKSKALSAERDTIFALALLPFNNSDPIHVRILQTIYIDITGVDLCPRFGPHWESIGFQGEDPSTDLRGVGMFGLFQLLHFVKKHSELALKIHKLSRDERQDIRANSSFHHQSNSSTEFPFQCRELNAASKKHDSVLKAAHELHVALYYKLYVEWKNGNKTIIDFPPLLQQLTNTSIKQPHTIVAFYHKGLQQVSSKQKTSDDDFVVL